MSLSEALFSRGDLREALAARERDLSDEMSALDEHRALGASHVDLFNYIIEKYSLDTPQIDESQVRVDYGDVKIDVRHHLDRFVLDQSRPAYVTGTRISFYVPFTGDPTLLTYRPSHFSLSPPRGAIHGSELVLVYDRTREDAPKIRPEFDRDIENLKRHLGWVASDVDQFNSALRDTANQQITERREKLLQDRGLVESLGFPLKRRSGVPTTYATPEVRRRIAPQLPPVSEEACRPEPTLASEEYEHILSVISNMVMVMERSPQAFKDMREEDLRQHFLVQLNGHYEGQATGETFNFEGKTDILIRAEGRNIFIAECKFWSGPAGLSEALDQLLAYAAWRDTKVALLIFNRRRSMSTVLDAIPNVVREHPSYKADMAYESETGFRYACSHRDDTRRDLTLTVLVFDVPA